MGLWTYIDKFEKLREDTYRMFEDEKLRKYALKEPIPWLVMLQAIEVFKDFSREVVLEIEQIKRSAYKDGLSKLLEALKQAQEVIKEASKVKDRQETLFKERKGA